MRESRGRKTQLNKLITESDIEAAQQLIQLTEEDNNSHNNNNLIMGKRKWNRRRCEDDEEFNQSVNGDIDLEKKFQEVFKEDQIFQPKKKRYRSLKNIYKETKPVNA
ncbi:unnamed protein product [Lupinus luteus]|uniref:Uncharacterized protein n=1 Tax=Lupinus luteus TaxID=3873 RepID=A0AAV1Y195_LUPLU